MSHPASFSENADPAGTLLAIAIGAAIIFGAAWSMKSDVPEAPCPSFDQLGKFAVEKGYKLYYVGREVATAPPATPPKPGYEKSAITFFEATCTFYWYNGTAWVRDDERHEEFDAWRKPAAALKGHPVRTFVI